VDKKGNQRTEVKSLRRPVRPHRTKRGRGEQKNLGGQNKAKDRGSKNVRGGSHANQGPGH